MATDEIDEKRLRALRERGWRFGGAEYDDIFAGLARERFLKGAPIEKCLDDPRLRAIAERGWIFGAEEYDQFQPDLARLRLFQRAQQLGLLRDPHEAKRPKPTPRPPIREP